MNWIQKLRAKRVSKSGPRRIAGVHPAADETAERDERIRSDVALARSEAFKGSRRLPLSPVLELPSMGDLVYLGVGYDDRLIIATSAAEPDRTYAGRDESPGFASFPHSSSVERYSIDVLGLWADGTTTTTTIEGVPVAHPFVQFMPGGGALIVGARARYDEGEAEQNAWVVSSAGAFVGSFCAGDGIQSVQVTHSGRVWIGYFDEGVFGNFGWGRADSPPPLGRAGLICWSGNGDRLYEFSPPPGFEPIDDSYALSVVGDAAWVCYYSDFPVVRVDGNFETRAWTCGIEGAHTMAVGPDGRIGLIGGYRGLFDRLVVAELGDGGTKRKSTYQLVMPDGADLPADARVVARGRYINVLVGRRWLRFDFANSLPA